MPKITTAGASHEGVLPGPTTHEVEDRAENGHLLRGGDADTVEREDGDAGDNKTREQTNDETLTGEPEHTAIQTETVSTKRGATRKSGS